MNIERIVILSLAKKKSKMWMEQRSFSFANALIPSLDSPQQYTPDYIMVVKYIILPLTEEEKADYNLDSGNSNYLEFFVVGCNNGLVFASTITPTKLKTRSKAHGALPMCTVHKHKDGAVLCLDVLGTMLVSAGEEGNIVVSTIHPVIGQEIATIPCRHIEEGSQLVPCAVRCVKLWEGRADWKRLSGEEAALYVLGGTDDGYVRLWRVDVLRKAFELMTVFLVEQPAREGLIQQKVFATPILSLLIDEEADEEKASASPVRLIASTKNLWACYELEKVPLPPLHQNALSPLMISMNTKVWARSSEVSEALICSACEKNPSWRDEHHVKWKPKHALVTDGVEFGTVLSIVSHHSSADGADTPNIADVLFPSFKNNVHWPIEALGVCQTPILLAKAHEGEIFSLLNLKYGRFASGGADHKIKVWDWSNATNCFIQLFDFESAHHDLVKCMVTVRSPDIFLSGSYDGTIKEWHVYDEPQAALCRTTLGCCIRDGTGLSTGQRFGICCMDVFSAASTLFVVGLYEATIRTYVLQKVYTCELPPGWYFDGYFSVPPCEGQDTIWGEEAGME